MAYAKSVFIVMNKKVRKKMDCKIIDNACLDPSHTQKAKCRHCPLCRGTRPSNAEISHYDYQFLFDRCKEEPEYTVQTVCEHILKVGITKMRREYERTQRAPMPQMQGVDGPERLLQRVCD